MDKKQELQIISQVADQLSLNRVKTEGILFDRDYKRDVESGEMVLVGEKAVVITQGKKTKVSFGNKGDKYKTYEEAVSAVRLYWQQYFKARRVAAKSDKARIGASRRQKAYRQRVNLKQTEIKRRA